MWTIFYFGIIVVAGIYAVKIWAKIFIDMSRDRNSAS